MKLPPILLIVLFLVNNLSAQEYFIKRIDFDSRSNDFYQIIKDQNRLFAVVSQFCGNLECSSLVELSEAGDTLWRTTVPDIDPAFSTMIVSNDTLTLTGNNAPQNTHFRMAHFDLDGNKLGETMEIKHPTEKFTRSFCLTTQKRNGKFHIMGPSKQDGIAYSLMYVVDPKGKLDTLLKMDSTESRCSVGDSDIDGNGNIVTFLKMEEPFGARSYLKIISYNDLLDSTWVYTSEDDSNHLLNTRGAVQGNNIALSTFTPGANQAKHSIRSIDMDKTESILYEPAKVSSNARGFRRIKVLNNGDILGMGLFQDLSLDPPVQESPWMIRISPDGDVRWQRVFYDIDPSDGEARFGIVGDVAELPNGDLYGVGEMNYEFSTSFVFKVDADGCLNDDDCGLLQFVTSTEETLQDTDFSIFPNPTQDVLTIIIDNNIDNLQYMIIDDFGRKAKEISNVGSGEFIDVSELSSGHYYVLLLDDGKIVGREKFVVVR